MGGAQAQEFQESGMFPHGGGAVEGEAGGLGGGPGFDVQIEEDFDVVHEEADGDHQDVAAAGGAEAGDHIADETLVTLVVAG